MACLVLVDQRHDSRKCWRGCGRPSDDSKIKSSAAGIPYVAGLRTRKSLVALAVHISGPVKPRAGKERHVGLISAAVIRHSCHTHLPAWLSVEYAPPPTASQNVLRPSRHIASATVNSQLRATFVPGNLSDITLCGSSGRAIRCVPIQRPVVYLVEICPA